MAPKDSKKRKTDDDSPADAKKNSKVDQDPMSDDKSVDSVVASSHSKLEKKELKELLKNHLIGDKLLNINTDAATQERQKVFATLKEQGLVEVVKEKTITIKSYRLTEKGFNEASPKEFKDDMARKPKTDEELREIIKKYSYHRPTATKIFDTLLQLSKERKTILKKDLAGICGTESSKTNFFYSLQQMKKQGYVHESEMKTLRLRKKAFVNGAVPFNEESAETKVEGEVEEAIVA